MNIRGWEVINEYGSSVVALSKQISDDEDVFVSFKADMQSDISVPEDVGTLFHFHCRRSQVMPSFSLKFFRMWELMLANLLIPITIPLILMELIFR